MTERIRLGMVGGGEGAFIGAVLDDHYELVAGALSSTPDKSRRSARAIGLPRSYDDFETMAKAEAARDDGIEAVAIVTPNHLHAPVATAFLKVGVHVICDKPLATTSTEAKKLAALAARSGRILAFTHNYTGYPMVRHARQMVGAGQLGELRVVQVEYPQDWLTGCLEKTGQKQAAPVYRPGAKRRRRLHRRHRHTRLPAGRLRHRRRRHRALRRTQHLRQRPASGRQRAGDAALCQRRARPAVGEPGVPATRTHCASASTAARAACLGSRSTPTSCFGRRSANLRRRSRAARPQRTRPRRASCSKASPR